MVNLVNTVGWLTEMLSIKGKSHVIRHMLTLWVFCALKKLLFWQNRKEVLNWLNSASGVKLHKGHVQVLQDEITYRSHLQGSGREVAWRGYVSCWGWSVFTNGRSCNNTNALSQSKCQLVVKLKANECYQELLRSLSFYIYNAVVKGPRIIWFSTWSNTWPTNIIFKKQINLIFIIIKTHHYWLTTLVMRWASTLLL